MASDLLHNTSIEEIAKRKGSAIFFHSEQTVKQALTELDENKITSAPVLDIQNNRALGFVDMLDFVKYALDVAKEQQHTKDLWLRQIIKSTTLFGNEKLGKLIDDSGRNPFRPLTMNATLSDAAQIFRTGVHRIPIVNEKGEVVCIISQSDLVAFLHKNTDMFQAVLNKKVSDASAKLIHKVITVHMSSPVIDAFEMLYTKGVNAVAIVDNDGRIVGNLSPADLKGIVGHSFESLYGDVDSFLKLVRSKEIQKQEHQVATVSADSTLQAAVDRMMELHVHRIYIENVDRKPVGVITLTDIISALV